MTAHNVAYDMFTANLTLPDPGSGGTIAVDRNPCVVLIDSSGSEFRTIANPDRPGVSLMVMARSGDSTILASNTSYTVSSTTSPMLYLVSYGSGPYLWTRLNADVPLVTGIPGPVGEQGPQGPQGPQGAQGPAGPGVMITQTFETPDDLPGDAVSGDSAYVGTSLPYTIYIMTDVWSPVADCVTGLPGATVVSPVFHRMFIEGQIVPSAESVHSLPAWQVGNVEALSITQASCRLSVPSTVDIHGELFLIPGNGASWSESRGTFTIYAGSRVGTVSNAIGGQIGGSTCLVPYITSGWGGRHLELLLRLDYQ